MTQQTQQQEQVLLKQMAHDIRGPLNTLIGYLELELEDKKDNAFLQKALSSAKEINQLINDVLSVGKVEKLDLIKVLKQAIELNGLEIELKNILISSSSFFEEENFFVIVDSFILKTIIRNAINNSVKFSPNFGEILISITKNNLFFVIEIKNNFNENEEENKKGLGMGLGFAESYADKIGVKIKKERKEKEKEFILKIFVPRLERASFTL